MGLSHSRYLGGKLWVMISGRGCGCCTHLNGTLPLWVFLPEQEQRQDADEKAERLNERDAVNEEEDVSDAEQQDRHKTLKHTQTRVTWAVIQYASVIKLLEMECIYIRRTFLLFSEFPSWFYVNWLLVGDLADGEYTLIVLIVFTYRPYRLTDQLFSYDYNS